MYKPRPVLVLHLFLTASRVQKKRAFLTVASIAWGSLALLLMLAFGEGLKDSISTASHGMGTDLAVIWPGSTSLTWQGLPAGRFHLMGNIIDCSLQLGVGLCRFGGDYYVGSVAGKPQCHGVPDSATGAGDDDGLIG